MSKDLWGPQLNTSVLVKYWTPLKLIWVKINTNGTMSFNDDNALTGRVFRDAGEKWLCGYLMKVGKEMIFRIEVGVIFEGLCIA